LSCRDRCHEWTFRCHRRGC